MTETMGRVICADCGRKHGRRECSDTATWHMGRCDMCNRLAPVTEPRDFGGVAAAKVATPRVNSR